VGSNLPYFQQGYASNMADMIGRNRLTTDPYNLIYGSPFQRQNMGIVFPQGADKFGRAAQLEGDMSRTATELTGGSQTQPRAEADKLFDGGNLADNAFDLGVSAATGVPPIGLIRKGIGNFTRDSLKFGFGKSAQAKADAIAPLLLNPDPSANLQTLGDLVRMDQARRAYLNRIGAGGAQVGAGMFGAPVIYGLSQN
jgi:hypothetical protein